ncbi:lipid-A-disaccharide synthase [Alphaproteobacteria bacterium KMM 3653]|uniref:Lipid-A-disaccharide synthase n=1 Tax=Harenicola maris TaxID=2841044 RepID=A0AAP2CNF5_9RHOB|nr:lipid-A-disaccharide synthase [Harenicola maris]
MTSLFITAGEPSGDALGGALMQGLHSLSPDVEFAGIGGVQMQAEGLPSLFPMEELSVMGLAEILPKYRALKARIRQTAEAVIDTNPDALITIDSPDFSLRVARLVKAARPNLCTIHYVAPTVWAWRSGRAAKMARMIDHVLALFPFEPPYMEAAGMSCDFVGHPVVTQPTASDADKALFRHNLQIDEDAPLILALPGSRRSEVERLADVFGEALGPVVAGHPGARVVIPTVGALTERVAELVQNWPGSPIVLDPRDVPLENALADKRAAFGAADIALAASGTVSLELAASATPMVIGYDMAWLSRVIIQRMLKVNTVTLVNLVSETRVIPEYIGPNCRPGPIAEAMLTTLANPMPQSAAMALTMERLGAGGEAPGLRAARSVLAQITA